MSLCRFSMMENDEAARVSGGYDTDGRADKAGATACGSGPSHKPSYLSPF